MERLESVPLTQTVGFRLGLAFAAVLLLGLAMVVVAVRQFDRVNVAGGEIGETELQGVRVLSQLQQEVLLRADWLNLGLLHEGNLPPPPADSAPAVDLARDYRDLAAGRDASQQSVARTLVSDVERLQSLEADTVALVEAGAFDDARSLATGEALEARRSVLADINALAESETWRAVETLQEMHRTTDNARVVVVGTGVAAGVVGGAWLFFIARSVSGPVSQLSLRMRRYRSGDLKASVPEVGRGELRMLSQSFEGMRRALDDQMQRLTAEREQTSAILDNMADGVLLVDERGTILAANRAVAERLRTEVGRLVGHPASDVLSSESDTGRAPLNISSLEGMDSVELTAEVAGETVWFATSVNRLAPEPGQPATLVLVLRDVTKLRALERMKSDFVALVSHELRRPMTNLALAAELVREDTSELDASAPARRIAEVLTAETAKAKALVENILATARSDAGEFAFAPAPTRVPEVLHEIVASSAAASPDRSVRVRVTPAAEVALADSMALRLVVGNLLENALKYSSGDVDVEAEESAGRVVISVRDRGPGISAEHLEHIFDRFYRVDSSDARTTYGVGLGLYIARKVSEAMGGELTATSRAGEGSRFSLSLPASTFPESATARA